LYILNFLDKNQRLTKLIIFNKKIFLLKKFLDILYKVQRIHGYFHPFGLPVSRQIPEVEIMEYGTCEILRKKHKIIFLIGSC
jgi:hypothetical protein